MNLEYFLLFSALFVVNDGLAVHGLVSDVVIFFSAFVSIRS